MALNHFEVSISILGLGLEAAVAAVVVSSSAIEFLVWLFHAQLQLSVFKTIDHVLLLQVQILQQLPNFAVAATSIRRVRVLSLSPRQFTVPL